MRKNRVIAAVVVVAVLVGGGGYYYRRQSAAKAAAASKDRVIQATVRRGDINVTITGSGPVAATNGVDVKANQQGTVTQVLVKDGDQVKAGQVVMVLDNKNLQASLQQAQQSVQTDQDNINNLLNPDDTSVRAQQSKVQSAMNTLTQAQTNANNLTITAPVSGVVMPIQATQGSSLSNNQALFNLYDDSTPTLVVQFSQSTAAALKVGAKATVDLNGFNEVTGTVVQSGGGATAAQGNRDSNVPVVIDLPAMPGVRPGMVGSVSIDAPDLGYQVVGNGTIRDDSVAVRSQVSATLSQLAVKEGQRVHAGDLLAKLTSDTITNALAQAEFDLKTQQETLSNLVNPDGSNNQLRQLQGKLNTDMINLQSAQSNVADLQVKAPVDGLVSSFTPHVGDRISANQTLFHVADYSNMQIAIGVDELDIANVKAGEKANITLDALPGKKYTGTVLKVNPEGVFKNDIATFTVTVSVDSPVGLMAGMNANVEVVVSNRTNVLWVPSQAVKVSGGQATVQVEGPNQQPVTKNIQIGLRTLQQTEIASGLNEGDQVILTIVKASTTNSAGGMGGLFGGNRSGANGAGGAGGAGGYQGGGAGGYTGGGAGGSGNRSGGSTGAPRGGN
ncbi:MAG: efflux RND transporter periplasmic adaptor subunit [Mycobacterium leprae]